MAGSSIVPRGDGPIVLGVRLATQENTNQREIRCALYTIVWHLKHGLSSEFRGMLNARVRTRIVLTLEAASAAAAQERWATVSGLKFQIRRADV
jgi:hypothetical protein